MVLMIEEIVEFVMRMLQRYFEYVHPQHHLWVWWLILGSLAMFCGFLLVIVTAKLLELYKLYKQMKEMQDMWGEEVINIMMGEREDEVEDDETMEDMGMAFRGIGFGDEDE